VRALAAKSARLGVSAALQAVLILDGRRSELSTLAILLAICEQALEIFHGRDDGEAAAFVADLERVVDRTRRELAALAEAGSSGV
jgi:hypothetical protein